MRRAWRHATVGELIAEDGSAISSSLSARRWLEVAVRDAEN
jgi:hypothetical protein